jgi:tRNA(His) 5'-end guanylyltransferase
MPIIIRCDGKSFHSYTKGLDRPFDVHLISVMNDTAKYLCKNIQGVQLAYIQSDEISLFLNNYLTYNTQPWFENNIQKMVSVAAGMASAAFTSLSHRLWKINKIAVFDARAFILPKEEVANYFYWRMQDATRNSIQSLAQSLYSHKELHLKNTPELNEMCLKKGVNWNDLPTSQKRGRCIIKVQVERKLIHPKTNEEMVVNRGEWQVNDEIPIFSQDRNYIEKYLAVAEIKE